MSPIYILCRLRAGFIDFPLQPFTADQVDSGHGESWPGFNQLPNPRERAG